MCIRAAAAYLFLTSACGTPDRWSLTGGSTLGGGLDSAMNGERDFDSQYLEVGVSGPLGFAQEKPGRCSGAELPGQPAAPIAQPTQPSDPASSFPWMELALMLGGAGALKGSEYGYRKVKSRRRHPEDG